LTAEPITKHRWSNGRKCVGVRFELEDLDGVTQDGVLVETLIGGSVGVISLLGLGNRSGWC